jgi:hypothetical protein
MMIPTVHPNGTGKQALLREVEAAHTAMEAAMAALAQVTVHGRDYYVQGPQAYLQARHEMDNRQAALRSAAAELYEMYQRIEAQ